MPGTTAGWPAIQSAISGFPVLNFWLSFLAVWWTGSPEQSQTARPDVVDY
ncbi:MAG: hypothetical protein ACRDNS_09370 [Trebonia sp.]